MAKDIPDLLQTRSTDYDPPPSQVCLNFDSVRFASPFSKKNVAIDFGSSICLMLCSFLFPFHFFREHVRFSSLFSSESIKIKLCSGKTLCC